MRNANVALLQLCSGSNIRANLAQIEQQIKQLPASVKLVITPENALLFASGNDYKEHAEYEGEGPLQQAIIEIAKRYDVWLLVGSMPLFSKDNPEQITTSSLLFDNQGTLQARYDKLHMFDVNIADNHGRYNESNIYQHGEHITVVDTPVGRLGMTICYDLRFPALFQALRDQGAEIIVVPAAFTRVTGEAHWEVLLRARAIENQCWVLAAAQVGRHSESRSTWGHSMVIDPWGTIIAENADAVSSIKAKVNCSGIVELRQRIPVATHNRFQSVLVSSLDKSEK